MTKIERILLECRYMLSLKKSYKDIAKYLNLSEELVYNDLKNDLKDIDEILYKRISKLL